MKLKLEYSSSILSNPKEPPYYQPQPAVLSLSLISLISLTPSSSIGCLNQCSQVSTFRPLAALNTPLLAPTQPWNHLYLLLLA